MIKVLVNGPCGRMGRAVVKAVSDANDLELVAAVDVNGGADSGELAGIDKNGIVVGDDLASSLRESNAQVMIDFTRPDVVFDNVCTALENHVAAVVGTTGLSDDQKLKIAELSAKNDTPAFIAPNFAIGAVLLMQMSKMAAKYMPDVEIIEMHHDRKLDAPSGTAIQTAELLRGIREPHKQGNRDEKEKLDGARGGSVDGIPIHSVRLQGFVASQAVIFGGLGQTLTIRHDSTDSTSFMPGVVLAARRVLGTKGLTVGLENFLD